MSSQIILEIEKFKSGQNLKIGINYFSFPQAKHFTGATAASVKKVSEKLTDITINRDTDPHTSLFINQLGKTFPKLTIKTNLGREGKSFVYTFNQVYLDSYSNQQGSGPSETADLIGFTFSEFSVEEESPKSERPAVNKKRTADRHFEQTMNFVKG